MSAGELKNPLHTESVPVQNELIISAGSLRGLRAGLGVIIQDDKRQGAWVLETPPLASAFFGYAVNKRWDVQLNLNNLTNERYVIQVATPGLVQGSDTFAAKLTVKYLW